MCCLLGLLALALPRVVFFVLWVFTPYIYRAYNSFLLPLLAFIFLPYTGLAYAFSINTYGRVTGWGLVLIIIGVLLDLGSYGGGARSRRRS